MNLRWNLSSPTRIWGPRRPRRRRRPRRPRPAPRRPRCCGWAPRRWATERRWTGRARSGAVEMEKAMGKLWESHGKAMGYPWDMWWLQWWMWFFMFFFSFWVWFRISTWKRGCEMIESAQGRNSGKGVPVITRKGNQKFKVWWVEWREEPSNWGMSAIYPLVI